MNYTLYIRSVINLNEFKMMFNVIVLVLVDIWGASGDDKDRSNSALPPSSSSCLLPSHHYVHSPLCRPTVTSKQKCKVDIENLMYT